MYLEENAAWVPWQALPVRVGRGSDADLRLVEATISRQHALLEMRDGKVYVRDLDSRYGTYVNGVPVREWQLKFEDRIRFGRVITYWVDKEGLRRDLTRGMTVDLEDVQIGAGERVLVDLSGLTLRLPAGQLIGILGPSGVGKSMVLRAIAGIRQPLRGRIGTDYTADIWTDIEAHRQRLAFVPQDDVLYPLLTVRENVALALALRLPPGQAESSQERMDTALKQLSLGEHADKLVRVLSGGQRKRVSVALEWTCQPELLMLDEPTAGLDPASEEHLMERLVQVSRQGVTVLCSTHLMQNVRLLDLVLVMGVQNGRGTLAFLGPPAELLPAMRCRQFADVYERLAHGRLARWSGRAETGPPAMQPETLPETPSDLEWEARTPVEGQSGQTPASLRRASLPATQPISARAVGQVLRRSWLMLWRDRWAMAMVVGQPVVLASVVCLTQFDPGNLNSLLFFTAVVACWLGMNNSIRDLVRERRNYIRERLAGLSPASYLIAKWLFFAIIGLGQLVLFLVLTHVGAGLLVLPEHFAKDLLATRLIPWLLCLWSVYLCGLGLAWIVSAIVGSEEAAVAWLPILILPQILLSEMGTGVSNQKYWDARPFRPLAVTLLYPATQCPPADDSPRELDRLKFPAILADLLSLGVFCRPALILLKQCLPNARGVPGFGQSFWIADLCHLMILLLVTYAVFWITFARLEKYWPALIGY
jgi:ABC-type multidrug transport system ATPase subunit